MKMHKVVVYILDQENYGVDDYVEVIKNEVDCAIIGKRATVDLGEWTDDHPVNKGCDPELYFNGGRW